MLGEEVVVESDSPVSGTTVRLNVTPNEIRNSNPEAPEWAAGKSNIQIVSVADGLEVGRLAFSELREYAK